MLSAYSVTLSRKWCWLELNKDHWETLNGKEIVMRIMVQLRKAKPKNFVGNNRQRTSHGAVSKVCHVGPYPLHTARVQKSPAPGRRGD